MLSPKASLDLDAWGCTFPPERKNDLEYNLLLHKFKSFYHEVKDYQRIHDTYCSGTKTNNPERRPSVQDEPEATSSCNMVGSLTSKDPTIGLPETYTHYTVNSNKRFSQYQDINSSNHLDLSEGKAQKVDKASHSYQANLNNPVGCSSTLQHHNSSHNLVSSLNTRVESLNGQIVAHPGQSVSRKNLTLSRSSERLDCINNNHLSSKINPIELTNSQAIANRMFNLRFGNGLPEDRNIYDAVSPDNKNSANNIAQPSDIASSVHELNRFMSSSHIRRLEPSKSSSAIGSSTQMFAPSSDRSLAMPKITCTSNDPEQSNNSFGSSILLDASNNTSSSLSLVQSFTDQDYGDYVNIDFFLRRRRKTSPFEDSTSDITDRDEEETTHMSQSLSSERSCDFSPKNPASRELAEKHVSQVDNNSQASLTPASSSEQLDSSRSPPRQQTSSIQASNQIEDTSRMSSFFSPIARDNGTLVTNFKNQYPTQDTSSPKISPGLQQRSLASINENQVVQSIQHSYRDLNHLDSDVSAIAEANHTMRSFLSDLNLSADDLFENKAQRKIVKESFAVEFCGRRKLRHLFLFNDVIVCAKYQASSKQKFTFDVKWFLNLSGVSIPECADGINPVKYDKEALDNQILSIRTSLMLLRGKMQQLKRGKDKKPCKLFKKLKKKRTELEAELVLLLPHLPLIIKHSNGKKFIFFLSSNFDRNQWIESIKYLQSQLSLSKPSSSSPSSGELQAWIQTCRKNLNPSLGTFLLRCNCDDDLLYGDLYINLNGIKGVPKLGHYYFCFEVDSYGHFSQKASSIVFNVNSFVHDLNEEYIFPLDGAHTLRILLYEDSGQSTKPSVVGKVHVELSRSWILEKPMEKVVQFNANCHLSLRLSYCNSELLSMRVPHSKLCPTFGLDMTQVCKRERTSVPLLIQLCVNEVERRGMREVGIYRMSGTSTDIHRLKKAFETNPYAAELLLRDIDINSVTGFLKTYLREMPEGLFLNKLYLKFVAAFNIPQSTNALERTKKMLELFRKIPLTNQHTIIYLVEHLVKVNKYEHFNKMSLTNLATVFGPNILRPPSEQTGAGSSDSFTAVVIGSMSQAGILYFFLNRKASNLPLTELDISELSMTSGS